jgi:hypothetical protein
LRSLRRGGGPGGHGGDGLRELRRRHLRRRHGHRYLYGVRGGQNGQRRRHGLRLKDTLIYHSHNFSRIDYISWHWHLAFIVFRIFNRITHFSIFIKFPITSLSSF